MPGSAGRRPRRRPSSGTSTVPGGSAAVAAAAESQLGASEHPPGSNDGPEIAEYRSAVAGSYAGAPWCAYFASWCARHAGLPLGDRGQGFGSVAEIAEWARRTGRMTSSPRRRDLILFGSRQVGVVESVNHDGSLTTVEGNEGDGVRRCHRWPAEASGFVRLGRRG